MEPSLREGLGCPDSLPDLKLISRVKNMDIAALHGIISQIRGIESI